MLRHAMERSVQCQNHGWLVSHLCTQASGASGDASAAQASQRNGPVDEDLNVCLADAFVCLICVHVRVFNYRF